MVKLTTFDFEGIFIEFLTKQDVNFEFNGDVLFNGKQTTEILGYSNSSKTLSDHVDEDCKYKVKNSNVVNPDFRKIHNTGETFITEDGTIQLITNSKNITNERKQEVLQKLGLTNKFNFFIPNHRKEICFRKSIIKTLKGICDIIPQYHVDGYYIDLYIPKYNLAIEYDEKQHQYQQKEDVIRQKYIENKLGCKFIRIDENANLENGLNKILQYIIKEKICA